MTKEFQRAQCISYNDATKTQNNNFQNAHINICTLAFIVELKCKCNLFDETPIST